MSCGCLKISTNKIELIFQNRPSNHLPFGIALCEISILLRNVEDLLYNGGDNSLLKRLSYSLNFYGN